DIVITFHPRSNDVSLDFKFQVSKNCLYLDQTARSAFRTAVERYMQDFEQKNLNRKGQTGRDAYGTAGTVHRWGLFQLNALARPDVQYGYLFLEESPYFTLTIPGSKNELFPSSRIKESVTITLYFTRAQAETLVQYLDQDLLLDRLNKQDIPLNMDTRPDEY
ncbi:MAG: hypothetical protein ACOC2H_08825, partial [Spirochaetota bacterium]